MKAKTIVENKFWILEEDNGERIGTLSFKDNVITLSSKNTVERFNTFDDLVSKYNVNFIKKFQSDESKTSDLNEIYDYPTASMPYNALWQVEMKVPLYTKTEKSNSYHCAGYYIIQFDTGWVKSLCPKLITLQRYTFKGPFKTKIEMLEQLRIHNETV
jgi:hypothetical protein